MSEEIINVTEEVNEDSSVSKSKAKRDARKAEAKAEKAKKNFDSILGWIVGVVIAIVVIGIIGMGIYTSSNKTVASANYSEGLTEDGYVAGANLDKVVPFDYKSITIPYKQIEYIEDRVTADIEEALSTYSFFNDDPSLTVTDGDYINLNYSGSIDGIAFAGGTADNQTLSIGSHTFIDNFEEQLIGSHPGEDVEVVVTFPTPYENNPDLAGKEAVFACRVNSIYKKPELTDEFVAQNFTAIGAKSIAELRAKVKEIGENSNIESFLANYISENAKVTKAPASYVKSMKSVSKYSDEQTYEYYNSYYEYYYGEKLYTDFNDFTRMTDSEYEKALKETAAKQAAVDMTYEYIFKTEGLTVDPDMYKDILSEFGGDEAINTYGEPYLKQTAMKYTVVQFIKEFAKVEE